MVASSSTENQQALAIPERTLSDWVDGRRRELRSGRDIALQFGDAPLALDYCKALRELHEAVLRGLLKPKVGRRSRSSTPRPPNQGSPETNIWSQLEGDRLLIESLKRALLQYGDLDLVQACATELAMLERQAAVLKPDENAQRPKGIRTLMGVD